MTCEKCNREIRVIYGNNLGSCDTHGRDEANGLNKCIGILLLLLCAAGMAGICYFIWAWTGWIVLPIRR